MRDCLLKLWVRFAHPIFKSPLEKKLEEADKQRIKYDVDVSAARFNIRKYDENGDVIEVGPGDLNWVRENLKRDGWK